MDANLKAKWLADLRSGKFRQAQGYLHNPKGDSYCCLGVLCLSAGASFQDWRDPEYFEREIENAPVLDGGILSAGEDQELSKLWMETIGLSDEHNRTLIEMNDGGVPFPRIADYIEKNL